MKKIISLVISAVAIFLMTGCSAKLENIGYMESSDTAIFLGTYENDMDIVSPAQNLAITMRKGALILQKNGYDEFIILDSLGVSTIITNFDDMISYCFPENEGNDANAWTRGMTSLQNKCRLLAGGLSDNHVNMYMMGVKEKNIDIGAWKIKDILDNKNIKDMILRARAKNDNKDITFVHAMHAIMIPRNGTLLGKIERKTVKEIEEGRTKPFVDNLNLE